jgi:hypothetical protein
MKVLNGRFIAVGKLLPHIGYLFTFAPSQQKESGHLACQLGICKIHKNKNKKYQKKNEKPNKTPKNKQKTQKMNDGAKQQ